MAMFPPDEPPRRSIPRARSRRALDAVAGARALDAPAPAKRAKTAPRAVARPFSPGFPGGPARASYLGPRLLGPDDPNRPFGASIDFDPYYEPSRPPWLLADDDEEPDEEAQALA